MTTEDTLGAHRPRSLQSVTSQSDTVSVKNGTDRAEYTSGAGLKLSPTWFAGGTIGDL
jgi:hypothetical protein